MINETNVIALIMAAGSGERIGMDCPKQFYQFKNKKEMLFITIDKFQQNKYVDEIAIVYPEGWLDFIKDKVNQYKLSKVKYYFIGGSTRQESGYNAVMQLNKKFFKHSIQPIILDHDADRPLVDDKLITECIKTCFEKGNAIACLKAFNYIIDGDDTDLNRNLSLTKKRNTVQLHTPLTFYLDTLYNIYEYADSNGIKDMCVPADTALDMGIKLCPVQSTVKNGLKITVPEDLEITEKLL